MAQFKIDCPDCGGSGVTCTFHAGPVYDKIEQGCECEYSAFAKSFKLHRIDKCENEEDCARCEGTGKINHLDQYSPKPCRAAEVKP